MLSPSPSSEDVQRGRYMRSSALRRRRVCARDWKLIHSLTRLRSRTLSFSHFDKLAQQLIAKLACGAMKTCSPCFVLPSRRAVVDFVP